METPSTPTRGDETREAILQAAMRVFAREGYNGASTRAIANEANANQALIGYHFGGKQGLYLAVFEVIASQIRQVHQPALQQLNEQLDALSSTDTHAAAKAQQALGTLMSKMVDGISLGLLGNWAPLIIREQQQPTEAFELLYRDFYQPFLAAVNRTLGILMQADPQAERVRMRSLMLMGQVLVFIAGRALAARQMNWEELSEQQTELIKAALVESLRDQFGPGGQV